MTIKLKRISFISFIAIIIILFLLEIIKVEVFHINSSDMQYSVITKGSLLKRVLPSLSKMPGDGTSFEEGKVIVKDNKKNKVLHKAVFYTKVDVDWKNDTVIIGWQGFYYSVKLPRPRPIQNIKIK